MDTSSYTAESIIQALKKQVDLQYSGIDVIKCPSSSSNTDTHPNKCNGIPSKCTLCNNKECKQNLTVYKGDCSTLITLNFKFFIRHVKNGAPFITGFIPKGDSSLERLIKNKYIDQKDLEDVKLKSA